jgi:alpha-glucosidase
VHHPENERVLVRIEKQTTERDIMTLNTTSWWQDGIIYQIYPRSFQDSNGDGVGDLRGIISRLAYLHWLGVDALWLSPFYPSPMVDFGYDVSNYTDVDPIFGDLATFDELVQQAHRYGMKVIIDYVINHTSDQHPWFLESRSSRSAPRRDWYIWVDAKPDGSAPNNWVSNFGGSAWEWDAATQQYYLHSFDRRQPDLNWRNPEVQTAMFDVLRFWLEHGVDGFRIDAAQMIMKDPQLRDNPPNLTGASVSLKPLGSEYDAQQHLYDKEHPDNHDIYRALRRLLDSYSCEHPRVALGEMHILDWKEWASYYGANLDEMHMPFNFSLLTAAWNGRTFRQLVDTLEAVLVPGAWPNNVLDNHDEPRIASRVGPAQARIAMMLLLTLRGTPTLYYGDEIGMHDGDIPPERVYDPLEKNQPGLGLGRDPERTPMQWDRGPNAGFCPSDSEPWLPLPGDYQQINVAVEREDPSSLLTLTRRLIDLRRSTPALTRGSYRPVEGVPDDCFVYLRQSSSQRYLIALNFSGHEQIVKLSEMGKGCIVLSTYLDREDPIDLALLRLQKDEGCVIEIVNQ